MVPTTAKGRLLNTPTNLKSLGKSANATVEMKATSKKLTHQGDRNKIANKERSDIFHFIGVSPLRQIIKDNQSQTLIAAMDLVHQEVEPLVLR